MHISINYRKKNNSYTNQRPIIYNCFRMNNYLIKKYNIVQGSYSELIFLDDVNHHFVERRIKLLINV